MAAYELGGKVVEQALAGLSPAQLQDVKRSLIALVPGHAGAIQADDRASRFKQALNEYFNTNLSGRRAGL